MIHETAFAGTEFFHIFQARLVHFHIFQKVCHGNASASGWGHGSFSSHNIIPVYHPSLFMGGYGNVAADMAYHIAALPIWFLHHVLAVPDGGFLQVQGMEVDDAVYAPDACHAGKVLKLIHIRRVYHHCFGAVGLCKFIGQL